MKKNNYALGLFLSFCAANTFASPPSYIQSYLENAIGAELNCITQVAYDVYYYNPNDHLAADKVVPMVYQGQLATMQTVKLPIPKEDGNGYLFDYAIFKSVTDEHKGSVTNYQLTNEACNTGSAAPHRGFMMILRQDPIDPAGGPYTQILCKRGL
jgi:hypothetical protein